MNRRIATSVLALSVTFCMTAVSQTASFAPRGTTTTVTTPGTAPKGKVKMVSFSLRNGSKSPLQLQIGDQQITVAAGQTASLKVQQGIQIVSMSATTQVAAGSVVGTVDNTLQGNTLVVN